MIPADAGGEVIAALEIPTIGIGGAQAPTARSWSGEAFGVDAGHTARFVKKDANVHTILLGAGPPTLATSGRQIPRPEHTFSPGAQ